MAHCPWKGFASDRAGTFCGFVRHGAIGTSPPDKLKKTCDAGKDKCQKGLDKHKPTYKDTDRAKYDKTRKDKSILDKRKEENKI